MLPLYSVANSRLLVFLAGLILLITSAYAAPRPEPGLLGDLRAEISKDLNLTEIIDTGITTLASLILALKSGQVNQNGLWGIVNINNITANAGPDNTKGTNNFLSTIKGQTEAGCPDIAVLFARGTKEPGNMGFLAGPPFATALQHYANGSQLAIQGVEYPANIVGFKAGGSPEGAETMAALANATREMCPSAKVVLAGYSQGAQVARKACGFLGTDAAAQLTSVVLFGDPGNGTAVPGVSADRVFTACHDGDRICGGGLAVLPQHLDYSSDAPAAALFVMQRTGLGMGGSDAVMDGMSNIPMMNATAQAGLGDKVLGDLSSDGNGALGLG
ncbi:putative Cutinase-domain-containing protein [Seiridium cardinale]|uniref:cutinase n=1 Tax=Seiridium cardinale TaxID=138064 RepID=A0ABR2XIJ7_9PEZI